MRYAVIDIETTAIDTAADYIEPASAPANYKDEAKIAAYVKDATAEKVQKAGLDPDLNRIVCIGWRFHDSTHVGAVSCRSEEAEANALGYFWGQVRNCGLITFNGRRFDLPVLIRRSMYLGVKHAPVNMDRYRSPHIDLFEKLTFGGAITAHSLKFYAKRLGLELKDEITGKDIAALVKAGTEAADEAARDACWHAIEMHCKSDVNLTFQLAERMGVLESVTYPEAQMAAEAGAF